MLCCFLPFVNVIIRVSIEVYLIFMHLVRAVKNVLFSVSISYFVYCCYSCCLYVCLLFVVLFATSIRIDKSAVCEIVLR